MSSEIVLTQLRLEDRLSRSRHTCIQCQKIVIDPGNSSIPVKKTTYETRTQSRRFRNTFQYTVAELLQANQDACPIFTQLFRNIDAEALLNTKNSSRNLNIHLQISADGFCEQGTAPNVRLAKIDCQWADTEESLMSYDAIMKDYNKYYFEAEADDPAGVYASRRPSYPYVISDSTFEMIHTWLQECESHVDCIKALQKYENGRLVPGPARLLYLEPSGSTTKVKIADAKGTEKYAALSYCWGKDSSMQLLRSTIDAWKKALPVDELPQTIKDAISTTRRLGIEYLWVDRICIIQDDREDTTRELSAMAKIYEKSYVTLSAASAPSATDGFLQSYLRASIVMRNTRTALEYRCPDGSKGTVGFKTAAFQNEEFLPDTKAVATRAWTMQEQMLSTRIVHFCSNMLWWQCLCRTHSHIHGEGGAVELSTDEMDVDVRVQRFEKLPWWHVVKDYSERNLSFPGDKLIAISALADKFAQIFKTRLEMEHPRYLAGLWEHELVTSLCWCLEVSRASPQKRPSKYRAPSWSWASIDGELISLGQDRRPQMTFEILACGVEPASASAPYLSVLSGYITIKAHLREDIWDRKTQKLLRAMGKDYKGDDAPDGRVDALETDLVENEDGTVPVFCLLMGDLAGAKSRPFGLILVKALSDPEKYRRVGYFEFELIESTHNFIDFSSDSFKDSEAQVITII